MPDINLENAIRAELEKPTGPITEADMLELTSLSAWHMGISDLTGLEYATNLTRLDLEANEINNI